MKRNFLYLFLSSIMILSLTGCQDSVDIIISGAPIPPAPESIPNEITIGTSNSVTDDTSYIETDITIVVTSYEISITTETPPRPSIEEELELYEKIAADISFEPINETEETKLAKQYVAGIWKAEHLQLAALASPTLDKYIDNDYLKDYIAFKLKMWFGDMDITSFDDVPFFDVPLIEAVEQKQAGDITYIYVKGLMQYCVNGCWFSTLGKSWVGIRDGKVVDDGVVIEEDEYELIGIEKTEKNKYGELIYPFPPERNPWDNMDDIKKIYDGLKSQGFGIEMKE